MFPTLLGFNLGGYALIVGFGNTAFIRDMTKPTPVNKYSIFQRLNSVFAFSILLQVSTLLLGFIFSLFDILDFKTTNFPLADWLNMFYIFPLLLISIWSLLTIPYVVSNIFNFGQLHHFFLYKERLNEQNKKQNDIKSKLS